MATFEDRGEIIDYIMKRLEKLVLEPESFVVKDLDKFSLRIKKQEERLARIVKRVERLENKIRAENSSSESESNSSSY